MNMPADFTEKSIINEYYLSEEFKTIYGEDIFDDLMPVIIDKSLTSFLGRAESLLLVIRNLEQGNYAKAKLHLGVRDQWDYFSKEISTLRSDIKSLVSGLIFTSSIREISAIENAKMNLSKYYSAPQSENDLHGLHHTVFMEFMGVNTMSDLIQFNDYFRNFIIKRIYRLAAIIIRRMSYSIEVFRNEAKYLAACNDVQGQLEVFQEEIEERHVRKIFLSCR